MAECRIIEGRLAGPPATTATTRRVTTTAEAVTETIITSMVAVATEVTLMVEAMVGLGEAMEGVDMVMIETTVITEVDRASTTKALMAEESAEVAMDMTETEISEAMRERLP